MLNETTAARIRSKISDFHTQDISAYTPAGLVGISEYVYSTIISLNACLLFLVSSWKFEFRCWHPLRGRLLLLQSRTSISLFSAVKLILVLRFSQADVAPTPAAPAPPTSPPPTTRVSPSPSPAPSTPSSAPNSSSPPLA